MAKKRLTFEVEEDLHSALKQEAAKHGVPLGALCSSLLSSSLGSGETLAVKSFSPTLLSSLTTPELRNELSEIGKRRPAGWEKTLKQLNAELARRIRI